MASLILERSLTVICAGCAITALHRWISLIWPLGLVANREALETQKHHGTEDPKVLALEGGPLGRFLFCESLAERLEQAAAA